MEKTRTTITIDQDLLDEITKLAEKEERSVSQQISFILRDYLKAKAHAGSN